MRFVVILALASIALGACKKDATAEARALTGGDPEQGREAIRKNGCGSCHTIPGVDGATALVGPPLDKLSKRTYLAGALPNTPENLQKWVQHPQAVKPGNAMPELGIEDAEAKDISAYLYTLR